MSPLCAGTHLVIQGVWSKHIVIDHNDIDSPLPQARKVPDELLQFRSAHAVSTVHCDWSSDGTTMHDGFECVGHFLVVSHFSRLTKGILGIGSVDAPNHVVELRRCEDAIVFRLDTQDIKRGL